MFNSRKKRYYFSGTPEYNKMFARKIFFRALKKDLLKLLKIIIILVIFLAFVYWMFIILKAKII
ncbi:MAG TPA: hypothetical protein PK142_02980 [bacterium]|nr:hypothetical protein [bacterium]